MDLGHCVIGSFLKRWGPFAQREGRVIYQINAVTPVTPKTQHAAAEDQQAQRQNPQNTSNSQGADAVAQASAPGTVEIARSAAVPAPEATARTDTSPPPRPGRDVLSLPVRADARSVVMAIASDKEPQVYPPEADMAAQQAAAERARIMSRAQSIVEAVMAQDFAVARRNPYEVN